MAKKDKDNDQSEQPAYELDPGTPAEAPSPTDQKLDQLLAAIDGLVKLQMLQLSTGQAAKSAETDGLLSKLTEALERVSSNSLKGAEVVAASYRQVHRPSNEVVPARSVFNPRGNPALHPPDQPYERPMLRCDCWVPRVEQVNDNMLTREETELLNILVECPGSYVIRRIDDTKVKMGVKVIYGLDEKTPTRLMLDHETTFNNEYYRLLPSLHSQIRQMLSQHPDPEIRKRADAVLTMDEEMALIQAGKLSVAA